MAMRRLMAAAAVSLVMTGCIAVRVPVRVQGVTFVYTVALEKQVRAGLQSARQKLTAAPARFRRNECGKDQCFSAHDVATALEAVQKKLRKSFPPDAAPLLDAVEKDLASQSAMLGEPRPIDGIQPVKVDGPQLGYDAGAVLRTFRGMATAIDRFLNFNQLALTLHVVTSPTNADFAIQLPANNGTRRSVTTDSHMPNVWRGFYTATVTKRGFKNAVTSVDLINGGPTEVTCTLMPQSASDDSVCHVR
jgi:hypothetical protein